jgi:hypothetical protein
MEGVGKDRDAYRFKETPEYLQIVSETNPL